MKTYDLLLVSTAFIIAVAGVLVSQKHNALTIVYGRNDLNQCLQADPSTLQPGCSTSAASLRCTVIIYGTWEQVPAYNSKLGSTCVAPLYYN